MEVRKLREWKEAETREQFMEIKGGKGYTIADIEALPEGERAELIDGELFRMDSPLRIHQDILMQLAIEISLYVKKNKGNCKVYPAPFAVRIKKDNRNYVEPDISVICDRDRLDEKGCQGAPDWVIEILSPSSVKMDCERKVKLYYETGVREYWIVDPEKQMVMVYDFEHGKVPRQTDVCTNGTCALAAKPWDKPSYYSFSERVKVGIFEDLFVDFSEMDLGKECERFLFAPGMQKGRRTMKIRRVFFVKM